MKRRLAAILVADVVGYSRLMGEDEVATLKNLRALREDIFDPKISAHNGRIIKLMGDGTLVEFASVVDAINCAVEVQSALAKRYANSPEGQRLELRIGINLGDVMVEGDDLYGDGVNVAARLEGLAQPGGICVSQVVADQAAGKVSFGFADMGLQRLKNIEHPVQTYRIVADRTTHRPRSAKFTGKRFALAAFALMALLAIGLGYIGWGMLNTTEPQETALVLPDKPSIAVLPFQDLSEADPQQWFGDGMAEDIITDLSKLSGLFVIARNSSFQYRGGNHDLRQVGRELGVAYLLEGSVRRAGDTLRINAQLIDAATGGHVWAERYDGNAGGAFDLQDRVTTQVVKSLKLALTPEETVALATLATKVPKAHDAYLQGIQYYYKRTPENYTKAKFWLDRALELDPTYANALGMRARLYVDATQSGWNDAVGLSTSGPTSGRYGAIVAIRAAQAYPSVPGYLAEADLLMGRPDPAGVAVAVERGLALEPNHPDLQIWAAQVAAQRGDHASAVALAERAMRLNPQIPDSYLRAFGAVQAVAGHNEAAVKLYTEVLDRNPIDWTTNIFRAAALAELGQIEKAKADLAIGRQKWPADWNHFTAPLVAWYWGRYYGEDYVKRLTQAFVAAGVPVVPDGYDIRPEHRLDGPDNVAALADGMRIRMREDCCGGAQLMIDYTADGQSTLYWNGVSAETSTWQLLENGITVTHPHDRFNANVYCESYRNPTGSNETLDAFIGVCSVGVFAYGRFPLPD